MKSSAITLANTAHVLANTTHVLANTAHVLANTAHVLANTAHVLTYAIRRTFIDDASAAVSTLLYGLHRFVENVSCQPSYVVAV